MRVDTLTQTRLIAGHGHERQPGLFRNPRLRAEPPLHDRARTRRIDQHHGAAPPGGRFAEELKRKVEPLTVVLLLPMFSTWSGLNTRLDAVNSPSLLLLALVILAAPGVAKGAACWRAARLAGQENATALGIGALMNARGLMELIIINVGLQKGIIGPPLFAMLVLMAIVTTLMATPLFDLNYAAPLRRRAALAPDMLAR